MRARPPQVVVLDLGLPDIDGWELVERIRSHPDLAMTRIALVTSRADAATRERARATGCGYFHKTDVAGRLPEALAPYVAA